MTKEEILKSEYSSLIANPDKVYLQNPSIINAAHAAMDQFAKQTAISFAAWIDGNGFECELHTDEDVKFWAVKDGEPYLTTSQLYDLFLTTLS